MHVFEPVRKNIFDRVGGGADSTLGNNDNKDCSHVFERLLYECPHRERTMRSKENQLKQGEFAIPLGVP